ncbi:MAG: response regulator transcription factor [Treponema sp.]|jgi:DNA-binding response OmpR family regulator|nr:response regulator transcription factor [Treponema sp.]
MDPKKVILVVDDEAKILEVVQAYLEKNGYSVLWAANGKAALSLLQKNPVSLVLLDLMLPDVAGEELCRNIRGGAFPSVRPDIPIIMVTAKTDEPSIIRGLNTGADDYVTKPFSLRELLARIGSILRRSAPETPEKTFFLSDLEIDTESRLVRRGEGKKEKIDLTYNEYRILELLASRPHKIFTRNEIIDRIKGDDFDGFDRTIDTHIKNLRQKIGDELKHPKYIETVYGMGYRCVTGDTL